MARYRTHTIEFERQVAGEHLVGGTSLNQLARRHDISRELLRTWVKKHEAGEFASGGSPRADRRAYEAEIATRDPPPGCVRHSDRGSRYASEPYRTKLAEQGLKGSMGRRGNPYDTRRPRAS